LESVVWPRIQGDRSKPVSFAPVVIRGLMFRDIRMMAEIARCAQIDTD
jgi:hypothetical protein